MVYYPVRTVIIRQDNNMDAGVELELIVRQSSLAIKYVFAEDTFKAFG